MLDRNKNAQSVKNGQSRMEGTGENRIKERGREVCPKCRANKLFYERLPDGRVEVMCLDLDCDFSEIISADVLSKRTNVDSFADRLGDMTPSQLETSREKLWDSVESLGGRSNRLAKQQLALVEAELRNRQIENYPKRGDYIIRSGSNNDTVQVERTSCDERSNRGNRKAKLRISQNEVMDRKVPPQFNTPEAVAKRIAGIRKYHRSRKAERGPAEMTPATTFNSARWFDRLLKTLRDEAGRHEQSAKNYARLPEMFPLHIEHSARACELNRVLDLLDNYIESLSGDDEYEHIQG